MAKTITVNAQQTVEVANIAVVAAGAVQSIASGVPTKLASVGVVAAMADGNGTTTERFTGIAKSNSTDTVALAGTVEVWEPFPGLIYRGYAKTLASADTKAEILALKGKRVVFDLTTGDWTIDTAAADAATNCVVLLGTGDATLGTVDFVVNSLGNYLAI